MGMVGNGLGARMWELKRTDLEHAKQRLLALRTITLQRHAEEINQLDTDQAEIETLERLAAAVAQKYLELETAASEPAEPTETETPSRLTAEISDGSEVQPDVPFPPTEVTQQLSPSFGSPLRGFMRR